MEEARKSKVAMDLEFKIVGQDFKRAGEASFEVKNCLKRLGAPPKVIRRIATAAYEAEVNVVSYAQSGTMRVNIEDEWVDVTVEDVGPGIPDIELAMQEGYSTAPPYVKEMGFGSGMGLPNIKRNSDWMDLRSTVNQGTILRFKVNLKGAEKGEA